MCASLEAAVATSLDIVGGPTLAQGSGIALLVPAALCFGGRAGVLHHYYISIAKSSGKDLDDAAVLFDCLSVFLSFHSVDFDSTGFPRFRLSGCTRFHR